MFAKVRKQTGIQPNTQPKTMSPFTFQSFQALDIGSEDSPKIEYLKDGVVITAQRGNERIVITARLPVAATRVAQTVVKTPRRSFTSKLKGRTLEVGDSRVGSMHPLSKLNEETVAEIRALASDPDTIKFHGSVYKLCIELSKVYNVHRTTINNVVERRTWKHV